MVDNCRTFNEKGSFIVREANRIYRCFERAYNRAQKAFEETFGVNDIEEEMEGDGEGDEYFERGYPSGRPSRSTGRGRGRPRGFSDVTNYPQCAAPNPWSNDSHGYDEKMISQMEKQRAAQIQAQRENAVRQRVMEQHFAQKHAMKQRAELQRNSILSHLDDESSQHSIPWVSDDISLEKVDKDALIHYEVLLERRMLGDWTFMKKRKRVQNCVIPEVEGYTRLDSKVAKHKLLEMKHTAEYSGGSQLSSAVQHFRLQDINGIPQVKRFCARSNMIDFSKNCGRPVQLWTVSKLGEIDGYSDLQMSDTICNVTDLRPTQRQKKVIRQLEGFGIDTDHALKYLDG